MVIICRGNSKQLVPIKLSHQFKPIMLAVIIYKHTQTGEKTNRINKVISFKHPSVQLKVILKCIEGHLLKFTGLG